MPWSPRAELGQELEASGVKAQLLVVGGAAMALAYNMRRTGAIRGTDWNLT